MNLKDLQPPTSQPDEVEEFDLYVDVATKPTSTVKTYGAFHRERFYYGPNLKELIDEYSRTGTSITDHQKED